ncbi:TPA: hypothetical protein NG675_004965 [Vibrio parahaemolyticus]|nr:hypothetical protein [Vibrio parahaemolyticus]HCE2814406.1 hypothetical protein [Vibrio parahaemolyticus]HCE2818701.1 hypothetical protein [Vibrio parahaemolyticus]HCG5303156.1 hypothetical protein [Vibrio parahaemolyticus]HCG5307349.1 hypothetical protein [Vibrio parahaemolyticus]
MKQDQIDIFSIVESGALMELLVKSKKLSTELPEYNDIAKISKELERSLFALRHKFYTEEGHCNNSTKTETEISEEQKKQAFDRVCEFNSLVKEKYGWDSFHDFAFLNSFGIYKEQMLFTATYTDEERRAFNCEFIYSMKAKKMIEDFE